MILSLSAAGRGYCANHRRRCHLSALRFYRLQVCMRIFVSVCVYELITWSKGALIKNTSWRHRSKLRCVHGYLIYLGPTAAFLASAPWCACTQAHRHTGTQAHKHTGTQAHMHHTRPPPSKLQISRVPDGQPAATPPRQPLQSAGNSSFWQTGRGSVCVRHCCPVCRGQ